MHPVLDPLERGGGGGRVLGPGGAWSTPLPEQQKFFYVSRRDHAQPRFQDPRPAPLKKRTFRMTSVGVLVCVRVCVCGWVSMSECVCVGVYEIWNTYNETYKDQSPIDY